MSPAKEKDIKEKLTDTWKKEMIRVSHIPNGWLEKRVTFGSCPIKIQGIIPLEVMYDTLDEFGMDIKILKEMKPTYDQIHEVYEAVKIYRIAVRYLKNLKEHMSTSSSKWWENN